MKQNKAWPLLIIFICMITIPYLFAQFSGGDQSRLTAALLDTPIHQKMLSLYEKGCVIGGTSAELTMKTVKLASTHYYDELPTKGSEDGHAFRDLAMEKEVLKMTQATGAQHAVCYLDLDRFKVVNDTCGHVAGDELLRQLGQVLQQKVRSNDVVARLGGDEFSVLLHNCGANDALQVANNLLRAVAEFQFVWGTQAFTLGVSIGVVIVNTGRGGCVDEPALVKALQDGQVGAYATDVWTSDPPPADCPLLKAPRVLMTPHLGASSKENLLRIGDICVRIFEEFTGKK